MEARRRSRAADRLAAIAIVSGGVAIILSVVAILVFVAREAVPLFRPARGAASTPAGRLWPAGERPLVLLSDEYRSRVLAVLPSGRFEVRRLQDGALLDTLDLGLDPGVRLLAADRPVDDPVVALAGSDGRVRLVEARFEPAVESIGRPPVRLTVRADVPLGEPLDAVAALAYRRSEGRRAAALAAPGGGLRVLVEDVDEEQARLDVLGPLDAEATVLVITGDAHNLIAGTADGRLLRYSLSAGEPPRLEESVEVGSSLAPVTAACVLTGGRSLAVASADGALGVWSLTRAPERASGWTLTRLHELPAAGGAVRALSPSERHRSFLAAEDAGRVSLYHATSERRLLALDTGSGSPLGVWMAPRADGAVGVDAQGALWSFRIEAPHPEATWSTLFRKVWYEGYDAPAHVWQSSGSTDDFEPKLSLTPLTFGTLKGTLYALLFAVPVAILAAVYTALFAHPRTRAVVKPAVELMAGLPSVVIGFLAGLWMAPLVERHLPGVLLSLVLLPALTIAAAGIWGEAPAALRKRFPPGAELLMLMPLLALGLWLSLELGPGVEEWLFAGDLRGWLYQTLGLAYDQRNALVVGIAMGFAVIPIIFTISEDSISSVPEHLLTGALALGASRWQAALRVVLPTASPGVFSAVMIGFGRAVGETMIVLMATGNTPIMDWSVFNGLRTLSANIAVEMPEAPQGGTLYRVLFLAAALLFSITFIVNTAAELVRMRLRARFARL